MISLVVHSDRLGFNNASLKDYAITTLSQHASLERERSILLFQYGNKQNFIYFLFPEDIGIAVTILKEGHEGYKKGIAAMIEEKRQRNLKLGVKESTRPDRPAQIISSGDMQIVKTLRERHDPKTAMHPFDRKRVR